MSPFEYVVVLISIILGLGITVILNGVARLVSRWGSLSLFWPYLIWVVLVFVMHIHEWWIMYELRTMPSWSILTFLLIILYPVQLFILANLLFQKKQQDLKQYYYVMYPKFLLCALLLIATAVLTDVLVSGRPFNEQAVKVVLFGILLAVYLFRPKNDWIHGALALFLLTVMVISLIVLSDELVIHS